MEVDFLLLNERQLQTVLDQYKSYYNGSRPHQGIGQKIPAIAQQSSISERSNDETMLRVVAKAEVFGLHHHYSLVG